MAFSRIKVANWAFGELLTSAQMNALDTDHSLAIDGTGGGAYAVTAPLTLTTVAADITLSTDTGQTLHLSPDTLSVVPVTNCAIGSGVNPIQLNGTFSLQSGATLAMLAGSTPTLAGTLTQSGAGHILPRLTLIADAPTTYGINDADILFAGANVTAPRIYTITATGAAVPALILFVNASGSTLTLKRDDASTLQAVLAGEQALVGWFSNSVTIDWHVLWHH
jgi:hypothetical protein